MDERAEDVGKHTRAGRLSLCAGMTYRAISCWPYNSCRFAKLIFRLADDGALIWELGESFQLHSVKDFEDQSTYPL
eukprot:750904-Hanusia_phi.AAC.4